MLPPSDHGIHQTYAILWLKIMQCLLLKACPRIQVYFYSFKLLGNKVPGIHLSLLSNVISKYNDKKEYRTESLKTILAQQNRKHLIKEGFHC